MSEMQDWEKCYVMSQMLKKIDTTKPGAADLPTLIPEIARLLEWASLELSRPVRIGPDCTQAEIAHVIAEMIQCYDAGMGS